MSDKLRVQEAAGLLEFLRAQLHNWSRSKIKERLQSGCVSVNGKVVKQHDFAVATGDVVVVAAAAIGKKVIAPSTLELLYQDRDLIAINKPAGLLSVGTAKETRLHALAILRHQLSRGDKGVKLWPVHRIDRDTSGVMLFATSREVREEVVASWGKAEKIYLAIVEGCPVPAAGTIDQPLRLDTVMYQMHVGPHPKAQPAVTHYKTIRTAGARTLLQVQIVTGRQHQIRAHLGWLGFPVVGDPRYGATGRRMGLHAMMLKIVKPGSGKELVFEAPAPADFLALLKSPKVGKPT